MRGELACWPDAQHSSVEALPQPGLRGVGLDGGGLVAVHDGHACLEVDGVRDVPAALLVLNIRDLVIPKGLTHRAAQDPEVLPCCLQKLLKNFLRHSCGPFA